jgi:hypothetical protein
MVFGASGLNVANLSDFDLDYRYGAAGESLVNELLTGGKTVEVKRDRKWHATGNVFLEMECWYVGTESWKPSGITTSKADYWAFVLKSSVLMVQFDVLVIAMAKYGRRVECNIEPNKSRGYLLSVEHLMRAIKESE